MVTLVFSNFLQISEDTDDHREQNDGKNIKSNNVTNSSVDVSESSFTEDLPGRVKTV